MTETASDLFAQAVEQVPIPQTTSSREEPSALRSLCATLHAQLLAFLQEEAPTERLRNVQSQTRKSLLIIQRALDRYDFPALSLSYNGGKDCLVLLILYLSLLSTRSHLPSRLPAIYIPPTHPFASVTAFTLASADHYHLDLSIHSDDKAGGGMRGAFEKYLGEHKEVKAIFVGTRRTDPHGGKLSADGFDETDRGWPRFMRVNPVIEWHYAEVWAQGGWLKDGQFLRHLKIPYCELYDRGFTSLGGMNDTHPNPALKIEAEGGGVSYKPAYELEEDREERLGRDW
ncbi:MAG: hypothetical protein Q9167_001573 [Letrouitia subvulpina]